VTFARRRSPHVRLGTGLPSGPTEALICAGGGMILQLMRKSLVRSRRPPPRGRMTVELRWLEQQLRTAFEGAAWHGPAVLELLAGVTQEQAFARPIPGAHAIWELVLHLGGGVPAGPAATARGSPAALA
jgi:hypothetical protein